MSEIDFQAWLDARSEAYFARDFAAYSAMAQLPMAIATRTAVLVVRNEADLRLGFDAWCDMLKSQKVTHMISTARRVEPIDEGMISGAYDTEILSGATRVCPPYRSTATLRRVDGEWKTMTVAIGLTNSTWPFVLPNVDRDSDGQELIWTGASPQGDKNG